MSKPRATADLPPLYAMVQPGLETIAVDEITRDFHGEVRRTGDGVVVFRLPKIDAKILNLRTTEDVFLLAWGTDQLTYRAEDVKLIQKWTAREAAWEQLFRIHHQTRPKPSGKPTFRLVTQMTGTHGYRRIDAGKAMALGLKGKIPASWRHADENAALEIWLTINEATAYCGVRLSDRTMRHRKYKEEHIAASLRPTVAAAMARFAELQPGNVVLDPMCGAGTILAEAAELAKARACSIAFIGGDIDSHALRAAGINIRHDVQLARSDAGALPLDDASVDRIICNPPFGKKLSSESDIAALYRQLADEWNRVLRPGGVAVILVARFRDWRDAVQKKWNWALARHLKVRVLGQGAVISVWRKPD